jgi:FkbM family methyltransferase
MSIKARLRALVPNVQVTIPHVEPQTSLRVGLRHHAGLVLHGCTAYESRYVNVFRSLIRQGDTVLDIGANVGFYSVLFSRLVGPGGRVVCFEPDPDNLALLQANVARNQCTNTQVRAMALASTPGARSFSRDTVTGLTGRLGDGPTYAQIQTGSARLSVTVVEASTLDEEMARAALVPNVIKIDVEGFEHEVILGGSQTLQTARPAIVIELSGDFDNEHTGQASAVVRQHDYDLWDLDTGMQLQHDQKAWMALALPRETGSQLSRRVFANDQ